jgi:hypothetical protein
MKQMQEGNMRKIMSRTRFERAYKKYTVPIEGPSPKTDILVCHGLLIGFLVCR